MENNSKSKCFNFIMSSFSRIYGVKKIRTNERLREIAIIWCNENELEKHKTLEEYDVYFRNLYENWK